MCKELVRELDSAIAGVDPRKKTEVADGSFRMNAQGEMKRKLVNNVWDWHAGSNMNLLAV